MARLIYDQQPWVTYSYNSFTKQWDRLPDVQVLAHSVELTKPVTSKRPKPADLFASGTTRTVVSKEVTYHSAVEITESHRRMGPSSGLNSTEYFLDAKESNLEFGAINQKLRGKIKDQKVNLGNAVGEYRQTATLLTTLARDVYRTFQSIRSGRAMGDFVNQLARPETRNGKALANRWLQYQYGLKPLVSDIYGAADEARKKLDEGVIMTCTANDSFEWRDTISNSTGHAERYTKLERRGRARYKISSPGLKTAAALGVVNPLSVAWELMPWSFVIDWALPVGDFINSLDATVGTTNLVVAYGSRTTQTFNSMMYKTPPGVKSRWGTAEGKMITTHRVGGGPSNLPLSFPTFRNPATVGRMLNAMALIRQLKR